jgi:hypothetical protein
MTLLLKDPGAFLDYLIDWAPDYLTTGDLIADSIWSVTPDEPGGVVIGGSDFDATTTTVKASGGVAGHLYHLINTVTLQSGRIDERSITLRVESR